MCDYLGNMLFHVFLYYNHCSLFCLLLDRNRSNIPFADLEIPNWKTLKNSDLKIQYTPERIYIFFT